jgi:hypothetical protein
MVFLRPRPTSKVVRKTCLKFLQEHFVSLQPTSEHLSEKGLCSLHHSQVLEAEVIPGIHDSSYNGFVVLMGVVDIATDGKKMCYELVN